MCLKLTNQRRCLSLLTILGILQVSLALPIVVLSFIVYFTSSLGIALSPFWCGFILLAAGFLALFIRCSRLACVIFFHVLLNSFSISACFLAAGMTGIYSTAVHLPNYQSYRAMQISTGNATCIFDPSSNLYGDTFRSTFAVVDELIPSCEDLDKTWKYLISIMSVSFVAFLVSSLAIISDCVTPCVEGKYDERRSYGTNV